MTPSEAHEERSWWDAVGDFRWPQVVLSTVAIVALAVVLIFAGDAGCSLKISSTTTTTTVDR